MEDSLKGLLISVTIIGIFITCILNFVVLFPLEQGVTFNSSEDSAKYLVIQQQANYSSIGNQLSTIENSSTSGFDSWDITQGFMGSNELKQSQRGILSAISNTFTSLRIIATQVFGANSPVLIVLGFLATLGSAVGLYFLIQFIRSGK